MNNDHLVLMDEVRKLMAGTTPYVDYIEVSPPLIHILYTIPFLFSKVTGIPLYICLKGLTVAATIASIVVSELILQHSKLSWNGRCVAIGCIAVALMGVSFEHQVFADREHLLMVLATPWLVLCSPIAVRNSVPARIRTITAAMAAVAFAIKPFFYIFYVSTVAFALTQRSWRECIREREHKIIIGFAIAYLLFVLAFFPQYFFTVLPAGLKTYGAIGWSPIAKWGVIIHYLLGNYAMPAFIMTLVMLCTFPQFLNPTIGYLYLLLTAAVISYELNFGWYYTQYPFIAIALVTAVAVTSRLIQAFAEIKPAVLRWACLGLLVTLSGAQLVMTFWKPISSRAENDLLSWNEHGHTLVTMALPPIAEAKLNEHLESHPRFMFFTLDLWSVNLLKEGTPRENVGRFDSLWPLPGILQLENDPANQSQAAQLSQWLTDSIASDIERKKPDMIINDVSPEKRRLSPRFDMMYYFHKSPRFTQAILSYELADRFNACTTSIQSVCAFDVYYRK